ncbi:MAG: hypothetical protein D6761_01240 [Candidatus Dadabacteria bacterium]|nr:MAG: hypothetical protein D6761_01240 [Candidatus Dadabacteria bacterium]
MKQPEHLYWDGRSLIPVREPPTPHVIDSFVVEAGAVRGGALHIARFSRSARALCDLTEARLTRFTRAIVKYLPGRTAFVRLGADVEGQLTLCLRPLPPSPPSVALWVGHADERREPLHKGPDLILSANLRDAASDHRCHAGVFCDVTPFATELIEADYAALVGIIDGHLIHSANPRRLPSVTEHLLRRWAAEYGMPSTADRLTPELLCSGPFWLVNARIGAVPVTELVVGDDAARPLPLAPERTNELRRWLSRLAQPVDAETWIEAARGNTDTVIQSN